MSTAVIPELVLTSTEGWLGFLTKSLDNDELPVIDVEVVLSLAVDALAHKPSIAEEASLLVDSVLNLDDNICEALLKDKQNVSLSVLENIAMSVMFLINHLKSSLEEHEMFDGDYLNYEFARIADDDSLLLRRVDRHLRWL